MTAAAMANKSFEILTPSHQVVVATAAAPGWFLTSFLPTLISVLVIVGVNVLSEHSSLAAAIATAPTGTPLSIWLMVQQHPTKKDKILVEFCWAVVKGVLATLAFAIASFIAAREKAGMWTTLGVGYTAWFGAFM
eukprot:CAMPEP_0196730258 /NCGR_PEP_ID=MMETSP1091-20130531/10348_1 /TAXON_ID=302021 /ORGANISM="Rhodomonas sp., Strain CCMP768" /LENGTH=134 /DNA_ID=CAMNT_0042073217 /DNA_START=769 /DNA_END=1170 /DNA_ORIENTATION=+